ncbi:Transducin-like enhancer protein 4 [Cotesia glomerata]|uniref:Transducin-like enhancer protein 4 n=1 Tax=Cotesia glomerata TaxID=32391 RepID=A0AAV7HHX9_COTGL|nr:Transducin-like enhancer protein 4 [Cotesia glomerata]
MFTSSSDFMFVICGSIAGFFLRTEYTRGPPQPGQPFKFTVIESCDRIKEEFNFLQAQYHSLKLECEKLASEKIEIQRHYVMY